MNPIIIQLLLGAVQGITEWLPISSSGIVTLINTNFLGMIDLSQPNIILAVIAGILQFIQIKTTLLGAKKAADKSSAFAKTMQKQMVYFFPFLTVIILLSLPSALGLYWIVGSLFLIIEQRIIFGKIANNEIKT